MASIEHDNLVTLLAMTVPLPGVETEAKQRWVRLLEEAGVPDARALVLRQVDLWEQAHAAIQAGHTVQDMTEWQDRDAADS